MNRFDHQSKQIKIQRDTVTAAYAKYLRAVDTSQSYPPATRKEMIAKAYEELSRAEKQSTQTYIRSMKDFDSNV